MNDSHLRVVDRALARAQAQQISDLLGSRTIPQRKIIWGEPACPYKVPFHTDDFWFTVFISDLTYEFAGNHKRGCGTAARFCITLKAPWQTMLTTAPIASLSRAFGVPVYTSADSALGIVPTAQFLAEPTRKLFRQIDFSPVRRVFLNAAQIRVWSELVDPAQCAAQVRLYRDLLLALHHANSQNRIV